jgi:hypothetical protein
VVLACALGCHTGPLAHTKPADILPLLLAEHRAEYQQAWDTWAADRLQTGDILFIRGESRILLGLVNFSAVSAELAASRFSHVGLVSREDGQVYVYDIIVGGPRRTPFGEFVADPRVWTVAVKRLRPECRASIPQAVAYCQQVYATGGKFDKRLTLNNDDLYCSEMVEIAFRTAGLKLSDPLPINQLPRFEKLSDTTRLFIETATPIRVDQEVLVPGNDQIGIWSCPYLDVVLDATPARKPPRVASRPR